MVVFQHIVDRNGLIQLTIIHTTLLSVDSTETSIFSLAQRTLIPAETTRLQYNLELLIILHRLQTQQHNPN